MNFKVMSIFGIRPEAIKMAPLVKELEKAEGIESIVCVTGQHRQMLDQMLHFFNIKPQFDLNIMKDNQTLFDITTGCLTGLEKVYEEVKPDLVLVHGDTSTSLAAALSAYYCKIPVGHVEAGLRTYDKYQPFPEEMNRKLTGSLADLNFSPTYLAKKNLLLENVDEKSIFVTGNTALDVIKYTIKDDYVFTVPELNKIDYSKKIITMTAHRRENLGKPLEDICNAVKRIVSENEGTEVVYAVHLNPAVRETANSILGNVAGVHLLPPLEVNDLHNLMAKSYLIMTDSGGLQEEAPALHKPVIVLRNVTERPEGVEAGALKLGGTDSGTVYKLASELLNDSDVYKKMASAPNPFGDGSASERIVSAIRYHFGLQKERPADFDCNINTVK